MPNIVYVPPNPGWMDDTRRFVYREGDVQSFDILLNMTGIQTPSGVEIVKEVKEVVIRPNQWPKECEVIFNDNWVLTMGFYSLFRLRPERYSGHVSTKVQSGTSVYIRGTPEYWREFRAAVKEVALIYEN